MATRLWHNTFMGEGCLLPRKARMDTAMHTVVCSILQAEYLVLQQHFRKRYPHYCHTCNGWNTLPKMYDTSPSLMSLSPGFVVIHHHCAACEGSDQVPTCSLCGQIMSSEEERLCSCPLNFGYPVTPPCDCWEEEL